MPEAKKLTAKQELATVRQALTGLADRCRALGDENARLRLEKGVKCEHPVEGVDERNARLLESTAAQIAKISAQRDEAIDRAEKIESIEVQLRNEWTQRKHTFAEREREEWKRVWAEMDLWLRQQGVEDPEVFYRERKADIEAGKPRGRRAPYGRQQQEGSVQSEGPRSQGGEAASAAPDPSRPVLPF